MENMSLVRKAHREAVEGGYSGSLKTFAREQGPEVIQVVQTAHKLASKPRSEAKAARTRAGTIAKKAKKGKN